MDKTSFPTLQKDKLKGLTRQQQTVLRREAILKAAFQEFTQKGFGSTRMEDVARCAGVGKGSIYLHFSDKEALLEELIKEYILPLVPRFSPTAANRDIPAKKLLHSMFSRLIDHITRGETAGQVLYLIISEGARFPRLAEIYYQTIITPGLATLTAVIQRGIERGEIKDKRLAECPQLLVAPLFVSLIWTKLFSPYKKLDMDKLLALSLDSLLGEAGEDDRHG